MSSWLDSLFGAASAPTAGAYLTVGAPAAALTSARALAVAAGQVSKSDGGAGTSLTLGLATTAVVAGAYTSADITVDAYGRITAAANGSITGLPAGTTAGEMVYYDGAAWDTTLSIALAAGAARSVSVRTSAAAGHDIALVGGTAAAAAAGSDAIVRAGFVSGGGAPGSAQLQNWESTIVVEVGGTAAAPTLGFFGVTPVVRETYNRSDHLVGSAHSTLLETLNDLGLINLTGSYPA